MSSTFQSLVLCIACGSPNLKLVMGHTEEGEMIFSDEPWPDTGGFSIGCADCDAESRISYRKVEAIEV